MVLGGGSARFLIAAVEGHVDFPLEPDLVDRAVSLLVTGFVHIEARRLPGQFQQGMVPGLGLELIEAFEIFPVGLGAFAPGVDGIEPRRDEGENPDEEGQAKDEEQAGSEDAHGDVLPFMMEKIVPYPFPGKRTDYPLTGRVTVSGWQTGPNAPRRNRFKGSAVQGSAV